MPPMPPLIERPARHWPGVAVPGLALVALVALAGCGRDRGTASDSASQAGPAIATDAATDTATDTDPDPRPEAALDLGTLEAVALELGTALDADGRVAAAREVVAATDAVHVSLVTVGNAAAAPIDVRWRDGNGAEIGADARAIDAAGPAVHTFSRQPEGGWTPGRYEVEVLLGGQSAGVRAFEVR